MDKKPWITSDDGCALFQKGGPWSIVRSPAPNRPCVDVCYLLFCKKTNANGERRATIVDRRVVPNNPEARRAAVKELRDIAEAAP